jgi:hypothetical protein
VFARLYMHITSQPGRHLAAKWVLSQAPMIAAECICTKCLSRLYNPCNARSPHDSKSKSLSMNLLAFVDLA